MSEKVIFEKFPFSSFPNKKIGWKVFRSFSALTSIWETEPRKKNHFSFEFKLTTCRWKKIIETWCRLSIFIDWDPFEKIYRFVTIVHCTRRVQNWFFAGHFHKTNRMSSYHKTQEKGYYCEANLSWSLADSI